MLPMIQPGDYLAYSGTGFWARVIKIKTWSPVSHCEVALNPNYTLASRDGQGVGLYPLRTRNLYAILRPTSKLSWYDAMRWFDDVKGQKYDWMGLLRFFTLGKQSQDKQFCSEFAVRFYREAGMEPFAADYDADLVSPGMFLSSPEFRTIWRKDRSQAKAA